MNLIQQSRYAQAMARSPVTDVLTFISVARERSFTRAAGQLGLTPSAVSHTVSALEKRMGVRLLTRTTRSVTPTEAGERLLMAVGPRFDRIEVGMAEVSALADRPSGTVRITALDFVADTILWPRLSPLLRDYPELRLEINTSYKMTDIAADRFDFGVRAGAQVDKDMVAVRISPDIRRTVVGTPDYFKQHGMPRHPRDLAGHNCVTMRLATRGALFPWEMKKGQESFQVRASGQLTFNNTYQILHAALAGGGLAFTLEPLARPHLATGRLQSALDDWCPTAAGFHLYYPSRRQPSRAQALVVDALRHRS
jgi:DNA-binding transcriptional LysR family regulator